MIVLLLPSPSCAEENRGLDLSLFSKLKKAADEEKYIPIEEQKTRPPVQITGKAGPNMPAVPPGDVRKEKIIRTAHSQPKHLLPETQDKDAPLPPTTLPFNPKIPYTTIIFQNRYQQNLEDGHKEIIQSMIKSMNEGYYRGAVRIQSFSQDGHSSAMKRAQKVRQLFLEHNIPSKHLEVQALPGQKQGNIINIFLLGE